MRYGQIDQSNVRAVLTNQKKKNPARSFLIMAGFNVAAAIAFLIFYFFYRDAGGQNSYYLLIAAAISGSAAVALIVLYSSFRNKF